jgi:hypothetical protein
LSGSDKDVEIKFRISSKTIPNIARGTYQNLSQVNESGGIPYRKSFTTVDSVYNIIVYPNPILNRTSSTKYRLLSIM